MLAILAGGLVLDGCATRRALHPKLEFDSLIADRQAPQTAGTRVRWNASVRGGVGELTFEFRSRNGGKETLRQSGLSSEWAWIPSDPGVYATNVTVRDSLGYVVHSEWSDPFTIAPALELREFTPNLTSPQRAGATDIFWRIESAGGVGTRSHEFRFDDGGQKRMVQKGPSDFWLWSPRARGTYHVKATVRDAIGNFVDSDWSDPFKIESAVSRATPIAVFPLENLSGHAISLAPVESALRYRMAAAGLKVLAQSETEAFMARHRVRHVGGLTASLGRLLEEETGASSVLLGAVEQYIDQDTPRFALRARLVTTGDKATILWMDGVARAGHQASGWLELGRVREIELLRERSIAEIVDSLVEQIKEEERTLAMRRTKPIPGSSETKRRFRPIGFHRSPDSVAGQGDTLRIALLPFVNESSRAHAGRLMTLHFIEQMIDRQGVEVVEPGDVRQALLQSRLILEGGPSLPQSDLLRSLLNVDLVINGTVTSYDDPAGEWGDPVVGFSVQGIDSRRRRVGWTSISRAEGDDGVFFFEQGRVYTAHELAERMVREVVVRMLGKADSGG